MKRVLTSGLLAGVASLGLLLAGCANQVGSGSDPVGQSQQAINWGTADGGAHPYVGMILFANQYGLWRCTGALVSPTVVVTAGHCTDGRAFGGAPFFADFWLDQDINQNPNYPFGMPSGGFVVAFHTDPNYDLATGHNDLGAVVLSAPVNLDTYAALPAAGQMDPYQEDAPGLLDNTMTLIGYGFDYYPHPDPGRIRTVAYPNLVRGQTVQRAGSDYLALTDNAATGGACFGDSGAPVLLHKTNVLVGVQSLVEDSQCVGGSVAWRTDLPGSLAFLNSVVGGS